VTTDDDSIHDDSQTADDGPAAPYRLGATQLALFAGEEPAVDTTFAAAHRIQLDATSWVAHVPGWLTGSEHLLDALIAQAGWEQRDR
jgi:hypothetical protein